MMVGKQIILIGVKALLLAASHAQCVPQFTIQKGWLGGDNAISVQLSNNRVAWFFSDSFVGRPSEASRGNAKIVANSVAISECQGERFNIQYYWKDQGAVSPGAFFPDPKPSYKYWPAYAFVHDQKLYVILSLIGPKPNSNQIDLFNFKHYGVVLAVISNFASEPDQWIISYTPWNAIVPYEWSGAVSDHDHLYILRSSLIHEVALIRVDLESPADPVAKIEYWSKARTWKGGFEVSDAAILFKEYVNGSLNYNNDLKKWILVYGPSFLSNTINYRVADALTGDWSAPALLYKVPEVTSGNKQFHSTYFCYCAREQPAFDAEFEICITYDCNSSDFSKLINDVNIYVPNVHYISIK